MQKPSDPVIQFILDPAVYGLIMRSFGSGSNAYSRLSASRAMEIGYRLLVLRCAQIGLNIPTREDASGWWTS